MTLELRWTAAGDVNDDGVIDFDDIEAFLPAVGASEEDYAALYPDWVWCAGDMNQDGTINFDDVALFVQALLGNAEN